MNRRNKLVNYFMIGTYLTIKELHSNSVHRATYFIN